MSKRNIEAIYPLSPMQQGMLFHTLYAPETGAYFEQLRCTLLGDLQMDAFQQALQRLVERHAVLRTSFVWKNLDKTLQVVHRQAPLPLTQLDWSDLDAGEQEAELRTFMKRDREKGFDLSRAPLLRLTLIRRAADRHILVWSHHHTLLDGWSVPLLFQEFFTFYEAFSQGQPVQMPPPRPYRQYINWLQKQDEAEAEAFWRQALSGVTAPTPLTVDKPAEAVADQPERYGRYLTHLSPETTARLQALARERHLTISTLVQGAWALLLGRYSGEEDVVFGATVSGRPPELPGVETMVGLFINTLPIRMPMPPQMPVGEWLQQLQAHITEIRQYEYSSLAQIQGWSDVPRDQPLFESILVFENYPMDESLRRQTGSLAITDVHSVEQTNYPITVVSAPGDDLPLELVYDERRFDEAAIARMGDHLCHLLTGIAADADRPLADLPLLTAAEEHQLLVTWNDTDRPDLLTDQCAHDLFTAVATQYPEETAVVSPDESVTYAELNRRANRLAHYLQKQGVGPETLVGICTPRSVAMIVAVLGVLKAGGAYIPLDPDYPADRLAYMLADSEAAIVLTTAALRQKIADLTDEGQVSLVNLDTDWDTIAVESAENPTSHATNRNLAYVIYTSGSTGRPKGTMLHHRGLINFTRAYGEVWRVGPESQVLQFAAFSFDASVAEIFIALLRGATLHLADRETMMSVPDLHRLLQERGITWMVLPPTVLRVLSPEGLPDLQVVGSAGEACTPEIAARWAPHCRFYNAYGPTEATVGATASLIETPDDSPRVAIGRPMANIKTYVLDPQLHPAPVGVPGELHIGGVGVGRGYLNRPNLTAEKFVQDPFSGDPGARLYKTGDLVRYLPDGRLEFLGRIDHQVKLRGFRIELGEIEALLTRHDNVSQGAVVAREDEPGKKYLAAYVVPEQESAPAPAVLRAYLHEQLPDYMVPSVFISLDEMPLSPSGKINRRALPVPEGTQVAAEHVAPRTPQEEILAHIWSQVLGVPRVGVHDNFFELGGHSLLATQLVSRIRQAFQVELPLAELFAAGTVAELAQRVAAAQDSPALAAPPIEPAPREGDLPLSFAQQRLWFLDQLEPDSPYYNIPTAVRMTGALDVDALTQAFNEIVRRHETLRTIFVKKDGRPVQEVAPELTLSIPVVDLTHLSQAEQETEAERLAVAEARRPFDLANGPLIRGQLLKLGPEEHIALFTVHHIVSDGWSMGVLVREIAALYTAFTNGDPSPLPELPIQYADFAHWQREWLQGEVLKTQLDYWREQLAGSPPMLELPTDRPRPAVQTANGDHITFALPPELAQGVQQLSREEGTTLFMTLMAAFQAVLYRYTGQEDFNVGTPIANRTRREIEDLIGFFVNTLVIRADLSDDPDFRTLLRRVRQVALEAYAHQDLPFETLVEALQPERALSHTPLFQVMFVLDNNAPVGTVELSGLTFSPVAAESGTAKFDLTLSLSSRADGGLGGYLEYNTDLFDRERMERLLGHFQTLLAGAAADPKQQVAHLPLLTEAERQQMLVEWNETAVPFPDNTCIHHLFEEKAAQQPDAVAVTFEGQTLTYAELNRRANRLAHHLQKQGIGPEILVGISTPRCLEMIVGIMGVLKAGGAYIPLDPTYPQERLAYMLSDSNAPVVLTVADLQPTIAALIENEQTKIISLDADWPTIAREPETTPPGAVTAENLAYVIYTSGSTGKPKGTMLRHRGLCNLNDAQRRAFGIRDNGGSRVLQFSPLSFDASVWETFMALRNGATLVLARQETLASGPELLRLLREEKVTNVTLPPSVLKVLSPQELPHLETVIAAGEKCTAELVSAWAPGRDFFNAYGPTETTVCASMYLCDEEDEEDPPIGRPIDNFQLYVLDQNQQPLPVGVPGELCVGGVALARGYLHRPEMTAVKFIRDPFSDDPQARLYRTGDLVRYRADGNIEFLGRIDHQVKVRGFRIELGEIETALRQHEGVHEGVVLAREDTPGDRRLVAYVVPQEQPGLADGALRHHLRQTLPEYMVPALFVTMEQMPLSPSGKVDRQALPAPDRSRDELAHEYVAPRDETEETLAAIAAELLGLDQVGVHDNFFELGGHSLLATQFISRVDEALHVEIPLRQLFSGPTVAELAEYIRQSGPAKQEEMDKVSSILSQLDELSDEDARMLLAERKATAD